MSSYIVKNLLRTFKSNHPTIRAVSVLRDNESGLRFRKNKVRMGY